MNKIKFTDKVCYTYNLPCGWRSLMMDEFYSWSILAMQMEIGHTNELYGWYSCSSKMLFHLLTLWSMSKFFKMYQNFVTLSSFYIYFYLVLFYHIHDTKWMILMEYKIVIKILYCEIFDIFLFINIDGDQNIREKSFTLLSLFLFSFVAMKGFEMPQSFMFFKLSCLFLLFLYLGFCGSIKGKEVWAFYSFLVFLLWQYMMWGQWGALIMFLVSLFVVFVAMCKKFPTCFCFVVVKGVGVPRDFMFFIHVYFI